MRARREYVYSEPYFVSVRIAQVDEGKLTVEVATYEPKHAKGWIVIGDEPASVKDMEAARRKARELLQAIIDGDYRDAAKEEAREAKDAVATAELSGAS
jgi:hypothetical protein